LNTQYDDKAIEQLVLKKLMRMNAVVTGLTIGLISGLGLFFATNFLILKGGVNIGQHLALLGHFFLGYEVTFIGSIIGLLYGFVFGFIVGFVIAGLYNLFANYRDYRKSNTRG
jgi:hypothetical protein